MGFPADSYSALAEEEMVQQKQFDDKELADKVVALGVARKWKEGVTPGGYKLEGRGGSFWIDPHTFVRDWRVAGVLIEKCVEIDLLVEVFTDQHGQKRCVVNKFTSDDVVQVCDTVGDQHSRAITEACIEALGEKK